MVDFKDLHYQKQFEHLNGTFKRNIKRKYYQYRKQLAAARPEAPPRIRVASSGVTKVIRAHARLRQISRTESVAGGWRQWIAEGVATKGSDSRCGERSRE